MKAIIKKVHLITKEGYRERIRLNNITRKTNDIESVRSKIKDYTHAKYVHLEFTEVG